MFIGSDTPQTLYNSDFSYCVITFEYANNYTYKTIKAKFVKTGSYRVSYNGGSSYSTQNITTANTVITLGTTPAAEYIRYLILY